MEDVIYEKQGHIATVTLNRPERLNAYRGQMFRDLEEVCADVIADDEIRVAILTGAGRAFCAGFDLKSTPEESISGLRRFDGYEDPIEVFKPIIAAVNGYAYGGGLSMALACDIRLASETATFAESQVKRGIIGPHSTRHLVDVLPRGIAMEMMLTGDPIDAQEALRVGLVNRVLPAAELMPEAIRIAERIASNAPLAVYASKENALGLKARHDFRGSSDVEEGRRSFAEKRAASFGQ